MIVEIKLGLDDHVADVIEHYRDYGFDSREALVERALKMLEQSAEKTEKIQIPRLAVPPGYRTPIVMSNLTEAEKAEARERVMQGCPTLDLDAMLAHLEESRQDRKLPFRD
jgi:hypothetical protein